MITATRRVPLYDPGFARDPHAAYRRMREEFGPLVPVEVSPGVPATLVVGYEEARRILADPQRFPADPTRWQASVPEDCPVRPTMEARPNAMRSAGAEHARFRAATLAGLEAIDEHALRARVETIAAETVAAFQGVGTADLLTQFAQPLTFRTLCWVLGCPDEVGQRIAAGIAKLLDSEDETATEGNRMAVEAVLELVTTRRRSPGPDATSALMAHEAGLTDLEMSHQILSFLGGGTEPTSNLISNALLELLTNADFAGDLHSGDASVREALDAVLYRDPPLANFSFTFPPRPVDIGGFLLPADQPVIIGLAACNNDPALGERSRMNNRAHLAWGAGIHRCPAISQAYLIAETAILHVLDALPELDLAVDREDLVWRPGPFHRALAALPVTFPLD